MAPFSFYSSFKKTGLLLLSMLLLISAIGCAKPGRMAEVLPTVATMDSARLNFGSPGKSIEQPDGTIRNEWVVDTTYDVKGQWVQEPSPWVRHDGDGYRVEEYRDVWKAPHTVTKFCRLVIVSDKNGRVLNSNYEGTDCDDLFMSPKEKPFIPSLAGRDSRLNRILHE